MRANKTDQVAVEHNNTERICVDPTGDLTDGSFIFPAAEKIVLPDCSGFAHFRSYFEFPHVTSYENRSLLYHNKSTPEKEAPRLAFGNGEAYWDQVEIYCYSEPLIFSDREEMRKERMEEIESYQRSLKPISSSSAVSGGLLCRVSVLLSSETQILLSDLVVESTFFNITNEGIALDSSPYLYGDSLVPVVEGNVDIPFRALNAGGFCPLHNIFPKWSPETHKKYPEDFKKRALTLLMVLKRFKVLLSEKSIHNFFMFLANAEELSMKKILIDPRRIFFRDLEGRSLFYEQRFKELGKNFNSWFSRVLKNQMTLEYQLSKSEECSGIGYQSSQFPHWAGDIQLRFVIPNIRNYFKNAPNPQKGEGRGN